MIIKVIQKDISHGERNNCNFCPVVLATNRLLKDKYRATTAGTYLSVCSIYGYGRLSEENGYKLPREVSLWIFAFDSSISVKPFEFELPIEERYLK